MSSNIRITKTCEYCNKEYTAQTIRTRYCSHQCNRNAYRLDKRRKKIEGAKKTQEKVKQGDDVTIPEDFRCPISLELM